MQEPDGLADGQGEGFRVPDVATHVVRKSRTLRFALGDFRFLLHPGKLVVDRVPAGNYPHLTLAWYPHGLLDLHLKYFHAEATRGEREPEYVPLGELGKEQLLGLQAFFERWSVELHDTFRRQCRPMNPGWLARKGFSILRPQDERLRKFLEALAPKTRGKYRLQPSRLADQASLVDLADDAWYHPSALHVIREWYDGIPLTAVGPGGTVQLLMFRTRSGRLRWVGYKQRNQTRALRSVYRDLMTEASETLSSRHLAVFETIVRELGIDDVPELAETVADFRNLLQDPQGFVRERLGLARTCDSSSRATRNKNRVV